MLEMSCTALLLLPDVNVVLLLYVGMYRWNVTLRSAKAVSK